MLNPKATSNIADALIRMRVESLVDTLDSVGALRGEGVLWNREMTKKYAVTWERIEEDKPSPEKDCPSLEDEHLALLKGLSAIRDADLRKANPLAEVPTEDLKDVLEMMRLVREAEQARAMVTDLVTALRAMQKGD